MSFWSAKDVTKIIVGWGKQSVLPQLLVVTEIIKQRIPFFDNSFFLSVEQFIHWSSTVVVIISVCGIMAIKVPRKVSFCRQEIHTHIFTAATLIVGITTILKVRIGVLTAVVGRIMLMSVAV